MTFETDGTTSTDTVEFKLVLRDVLWLRRSLTLALLPLTQEGNWEGASAGDIATALDYANELFESLEQIT